MDAQVAVDLFRQAVYIVVICLAVIILPGLAVGLLVAMFQAATQINEMSLSFIPKLFVTLMTLVYTGPWLATMVTDYSRNLISEISFVIG